MRALGVQYGQGLQLINILRDAGTDLRNGRCYLPADELNSAGIGPEQIVNNPAGAAPVSNKWIEQAKLGVAAGIDYACSIRNRRIRFATALPALIGARTLALLREAGPKIAERKVKVPRSEVRRIILTAALASPRSLRAAFQKL
jgi:farnesyl-diphosphate farnesyltransferase